MATVMRRKVRTMGRMTLNTLAGTLLAAGVVASLPGCRAPQFASPRHRMSRSSDGRQTVTPAQEADVQIDSGRVAESLGNFEGAEAAYRAALKRDKSRGDAHLHLANILTLKGEYRQAQDEYQKAIEANPGNADVFCDIGYSFYLQHKWDDAQRNLRQTLAIRPDHRRAHNNLAVVLAHMNRTEEALTEFRKAGNSLVDCHVNLAFSHTLERRWDAAREEYRRAAAARPASEVVKTRLRELDHLIALNEGRGTKEAGRVDPKTVTASTFSSTIPPPRSFKMEESQRKPKKTPPPQAPLAPGVTAAR
jgi:tetratricopeptide (TPR) repeat protein